MDTSTLGTRATGG